MPGSVFAPIQVKDPDLNTVQQRIKQAFDQLAATSPPPAPAFYSFQVLGSNGAGPVAVPVASTPQGSPAKQALVGDTVVSVLDLTNQADKTSSFETSISKQNQIQQRSTTNLSAVKLWITLMRPGK